jgi:hypothetical protein
MARSYDGVTVEIVNWAEYNPRTDSKKPSWFRMENNFITGPKFFCLSAGQKLLGVLIFSLVSQSNGKPFLIDYSYLRTFTGLSDDEISKAIEIYIDKETLRVTRARSARLLRETGRNLPATRRTNETNETNEDSSEGSEKLEPLAAGFGDDPLLQKIFQERGVTEKVQTSWLEAFPDVRWIRGEVLKALSWEESNPQRKKKLFAAFITRWLTKGWDQRKVGAFGNRPNGPTRQEEIDLQAYETQLRREAGLDSA